MAPWAKVPLHLLNSTSLSSHQVRHYSDDQKPGFGFQSLSGLFSQAVPRGRYSRPRERQTEEKKLEPERQPDEDKVESKPFFGTFSPPVRQEEPRSTLLPATERSERPGLERKIQTAEGDTTTSPRLSIRNHQVSPIRRTSEAYNPGPSAEPESAHVSSDEVSKGRTLRQGRLRRGAPPRTPARASYRKTTDTAGRPWVEKPKTREERRREHIERMRTPNPFTAQTNSPSLEGEGKPVSSSGSLGPAWGLSVEDRRTINSITDPGATSASDSQREPANRDVESPHPLSRSQSAPKLTHVNTSGEAHMVDVGAKPATRRIAIATSSVRFSTPETAKLIRENSNKKGDVLGVARIAGLMAAKRTSDLIPLCHPVALTKADVDVTLDSPGDKDHGNTVWIRARVECVGPTGVEMEALTAASVAALTVYDMCKASDKKMHIERTAVVYKSGGRSGVFVDQGWMSSFGGKAYLLEQRLEAPRVKGRKGE